MDRLKYKAYCLFLMVCLIPAAIAESLQLQSPNEAIIVSIDDEGGRLRYTVSYKGEDVIRPSLLGMRFEKQLGFEEQMAIISSQKESRDSTWEQPWGERRYIEDRHNELLVIAKNKVSEKILHLRLRAFNDGVGFRYEVPSQSGFGKLNIVKELTEFSVPNNVTAWWIPSGGFNRYEYLYKYTGLSEMYDVHTPVTFRLNSGVHISIHEAALVDYSGMSLHQTRRGVFQAALRPWSDGILVKTQAPFFSPWRTVQIGPSAVSLVNSDLILNLNEANRLGDVSWVKPGKYVGIWWAMHIRDRTWGRDRIHGATTEETIRYMDFAAENGFDGVLVEGWNIGWDGDWYNNGDVFKFSQSYPDFNIEAVAEYGRKKRVRLIGHHETSGNISNYENQLDEALNLYQKNNVAQVKTGYVADSGGLKWVDEKGVPHYEYHDGQFAVRHHLKVIKKAARYQISINPHEPVKDTGLRRTYPNWISREGARGQEYNAWGEPPNPPEHTTILPYTRMLAGPMDFTPGIFDLEPNKREPLRADMPRSDPAIRVQTTLAKQLALYVVIYSPIQMVADIPKNYDLHPTAFKFIQDVPTDWQESIALAGEVGDYIAIARKEREGDDWYLGAISDENARQLDIPLSFLNPQIRYIAEIYQDGENGDWKNNPYAIAIESKELSSQDTLSLKLAPGGGSAVRLIPQ